MSYRALHERYDLPPPPARSGWSLNRPHDWQRAWLPDFETSPHPVDQLRVFLTELATPSLSRRDCIQLRVLSCFNFVVCIALLGVVVHRIRHRAIWLVRLVRRSNGTLVVPNAIPMLTIFTGCCYLATLVACNSTLVMSSERSVPWANLPLWLILSWYPLGLGAYYAIVASALARPDALRSLSPQPNVPPSLALRMGITPAVVNVILLVLPLLQVAAVLIPGCIANRRFQLAAAAFERWKRDWDGATQLDHDMLLAAQHIWYTMLSAAPPLAVGTLLWGITGFLLALAEVFASGALLLLVRRQIKILRGFKRKEVAAQQEAAQAASAERSKKRQSGARPGNTFVGFDALPIDQAIAGGSGPPKRKASHDKTLGHWVWMRWRRWRKGGSADDADLDDQFQVTSQVISAGFIVDEAEAAGDEGAHTPAQGQLAPATKPATFQRRRADDGSPAAGLFPAVRPSRIQRAPKSTSKRGRRGQRHYLERFLLDHLIHCAGITTGCLAYTVIAIHDALAMWDSVEANNFGAVTRFAMLGGSYTAFITGVIIIAFSLGRLYEPIRANLAARAPTIRFLRSVHGGQGDGAGQGDVEGGGGNGGADKIESKRTDARGVRRMSTHSALQKHSGSPRSPSCIESLVGLGSVHNANVHVLLALRSRDEIAESDGVHLDNMGQTSDEADDDDDDDDEDGETISSPEEFVKSRQSSKRPSSRTLYFGCPEEKGGSRSSSSDGDDVGHIGIDARGCDVAGPQGTDGGVDSPGTSPSSWSQKGGIVVQDTVTYTHQRVEPDPVLGTVELEYGHGAHTTAPSMPAPIYDGGGGRSNPVLPSDGGPDSFLLRPWVDAPPERSSRSVDGVRSLTDFLPCPSTLPSDTATATATVDDDDDHPSRPRAARRRPSADHSLSASSDSFF